MRRVDLGGFHGGIVLPNVTDSAVGFSPNSSSRVCIFMFVSSLDPGKGHEQIAGESR